uniref:Nuclear protein 1 n=1 Tax=Glossina morsitans morsitans TaxID=37546 RepID=A0A1B0G7A1_GLOMM
MSEAYFDAYDHYNYDQDNGKNRTKREASEHSNHFDPNGHSRKLLTKFMNTNNNKKLIHKN